LRPFLLPRAVSPLLSFRIMERTMPLKTLTPTVYRTGKFSPSVHPANPTGCLTPPHRKPFCAEAHKQRSPETRSPRSRLVLSREYSMCFFPMASFLSVFSSRRKEPPPASIFNGSFLFFIVFFSPIVPRSPDRRVPFLSRSAFL